MVRTHANDVGQQNRCQVPSQAALSLHLTLCSVAAQAALGPERVGYQRGALLAGWGGDGELDGAAFDCRDADACIVFLGLSALGVSDYHPPLYQEHVRSHGLQACAQHTARRGVCRCGVQLQPRRRAPCA